LPPTLDKPLQLAPATQLAGGKKENPIEPKKPIEPKPIAKNHAIFILPPHKWDKSQITKTATDTSYIVENVWIREQVGADNKITYHYYQEGYDINKALCWQYFEPQTEQKVSIESDAPEIAVEERRYTPEELAAIKQRRRELMYVIASDEKLFFQFYLNENYSQEFRTELYHMKIAIGRGEVAMAVAGVGFSFMAIAAAPVLIEGAMALPSVSASALRSIASTGVNAGKGIVRGMKSAKDMAMAALKDMPKDMLKGTLIDKVGEAIGIPLGTLFDLRDAKELVRDFGKYLAKNPNPKLLTPDGREIDLDSPMKFGKDIEPNKKGGLSGGSKTPTDKSKDNTNEQTNPISSQYTTKIKWGIHEIEARPFQDKGYWGKRIPQKNSRVEAFEQKINPNNESFYIESPSNGGFVQFENLVDDKLQDGKLILQTDNSIYHIYDKPEFLSKNIEKEALRQAEAAHSKGLSVEWLVSDRKAEEQLRRFFQEKNINITVKFLAE
jgi:hypothetical protein